ncbi:uncharacterized protein AB675_6484 [Cyphellophora attinorum]|uniref:Mediator complex subunit 16 C-terminal domain-containing protein n=1 Tax=Cyphellophora attinorum TaxID=1664694 RepID=A0A0N1HYR1_9EURO|nr:uncharacterized protein AB675_6484 [Phialophora attinorum]KPI43674.1 hypothetical protein AB675_6484 [Phialophora attinorum]
MTIMKWSSGKGLALVAIEAMLDPRWSGLADNELDNNMPKIAARQVKMMATGKVEGGYEGTVRRIATKMLQAGGGHRERGMVDRLKLWQGKPKMGWLLLDDGWDGDEGGEVPKAERKVYDVLKKKVITNGKKENNRAASVVGSEELMIKRCVRCGRHNEDVNGMGKEWPRNVAGLMMRCICDGSWVVEPWSTAIEH